MAKVMIHIGFHKTGTTSIQQFLGDHRARLAELGVAFFKGHYLPSNHIEVAVAAMREGRWTPAKVAMNLNSDEQFFARVASSIASFKYSTDASTLLISAEDLSYLRYSDEFERLRQLLAVEEIGIVAYLRDLRSWTASYAAELRTHRLPLVIDRDSFAYFESDSWLRDFEARLAPFYNEFGCGNVRVVDYNAACVRDNNVIPSFLRLLGLDSHFSAADYSSYRLNSRM